MRKTPAILVLACSLFWTAAATEQDLEKQLNDQYKGQILALRHPLVDRSQEYGFDGAPRTSISEGPWTIYGRILVNKIKLDADRLEIEGKRAVFYFDERGSLAQFREDKKHPAERLKIVLRLPQPIVSAGGAAAVLGHVFALTPEDVVNSAPAYWRRQLESSLGLPSRGNAGSETAGGAAEKEKAGNEKVFQLADLADRKHSSPPQALFHPEPEYSEAARSRRFQGMVGLNVVIDNSGKVRSITIVHPLGMGLDDNAVATVRTWQFTPATHDGEPVPVSVHIEVDFHLY